MRISIYIFIINLILFTHFVKAEDHALIVGTDIYANPSISHTDGAADDARALKKLLIEKFGFSTNQIKTLINEEATAAAIVSNFQTWLIGGTRPGDRVFFYYAGHGFQVPDDNGDEEDKLDEVISPYDVVIKSVNGKITLPDEKTFVRDDKFNDFIAQLSGRRAVLMFDSCHSGTIARGISAGGKNLESRYLRLKPSRSVVDSNNTYSEVPDKGKRDLTTIREDILDGNVNGVVVLSAASPYQQAFPINTDDQGTRGAFTYVFENLIRKNENEKLDDLENDLKKEMKRYADKGMIGQSSNGEFQVPQIDIISKTKLNNKPLFAATSNEPDYTVAVETAMFNPLSPLRVKLDLDKRRYKIDDEIHYTVDVSETSFLYILVFSAENKAFCIFPTPEDKTFPNKVLPGKYSFPLKDENGVEKYVTSATEPTGKDVWVALISRKQLRLGEKEAYSWDEMFSRIGLAELQKAIADKVSRSRGAGNKNIPPAADDWQASSVVVETVPK